MHSIQQVDNSSLRPFQIKHVELEVNGHHSALHKYYIHPLRILHEEERLSGFVVFPSSIKYNGILLRKMHPIKLYLTDEGPESL